MEKENPRITVLNASLTIEHAVSKFLGELLGFDAEGSKTLGGMGSSLSFKNKVDLICDIKGFESADAGKLLCFAEIRNQFMHNLKVDSFVACFKNLKDRTNYLKKQYSAKIESSVEEEEVLKQYFICLLSDIVRNVLGKLFEKIGEKHYRRGYIDGAIRKGKVLNSVIHEIASESAEYGAFCHILLKRFEVRIMEDVPVEQQQIESERLEAEISASLARRKTQQKNMDS